jgi:hypothetical protein
MSVKAVDAFGVEAARVEILAAVEKLKIQAQSAINDQNAAIEAKELEVQTLGMSVTAEDVAALIAGAFKRSLQRARSTFSARVRDATFLRSHTKIRTPSGIDGNGVMTFSEPEQSNFSIIDYDASPFYLLAMFITDDQIDSWSMDQALKAGCKSGGARVPELAAAYEKLVNELESMYRARELAVTHFDGLIDGRLSKLIPAAVWSTRPAEPEIVAADSNEPESFEAMSAAMDRAAEVDKIEQEARELEEFGMTGELPGVDYYSDHAVSEILTGYDFPGKNKG